MVKNAAFPRVILSGNIGGGLLVQPPGRQPKVIGDSPGLFQDDPVWNEPRIDIPGHAGGIVSQGHGSTAHDEYVRDNTPVGKTLAQGAESPLQFCPAEEDIVRPTHAASRSRADR